MLIFTGVFRSGTFATKGNSLYSNNLNLVLLLLSHTHNFKIKLQNLQANIPENACFGSSK